MVLGRDSAAVNSAAECENQPNWVVILGKAFDLAVAHGEATDVLIPIGGAGRLDQLLEDPLYLITVDPARLVPHLDTAISAPARATAAVYRQSAHLLARLDLPMRASQLELAAHHLGCRSLAARIAGAAPDRPWQTRWSHGRRATGQQVLTGRGGVVRAVAVGALPDGTPVIVSSGEDGTVRVWRLADGTPLVPPLDLPASVRAVVVHGHVIVTAAGADIVVHQPGLSRPMR